MCLALFQGCLALLQPCCPHSAHTSPVLGQEKPGLVWKSRERGKPEQPMLSTRQGRFWDHAQNVFVPCTVSHETSANKGCKGGGSTASAAPGPVSTAKGSRASTMCNSQKVLTSPWK